MAVRALGVALLLSSLPIAGCGTMANLVQGGKTPFGGVEHDVACIHTGANGGCGPGAPPSEAVRLCSAIDLPFSFVGDLVTWPYTASYTCINGPVPTPPVLYAPVGNPPQNRQTSQSPPIETLPEPRKSP